MVIKINIKLIATIFVLLSATSLTFGEDIEVKIRLESNKNSILRVEGKFRKEKTSLGLNWSFLNSYADANNLAKRVRGLHLYDGQGNRIAYKRFADGEVIAERKVVGFSYTVEVNVLKNLPLNAHISWANKNKGILMLNDLLPLFMHQGFEANISFDLPYEWKMFSREKKISENGFVVEDIGNAVFLVGTDVREKEIVVGTARLNFVISSEWQFDDDAAFRMAEEIIREYLTLFGNIPFVKSQIILAGFPGEIGLNRWRAETRGANVTILSSKMLAKNLARQRLHEQLRHEIFHFWIPNSLNLNGDYAWFYEGFAIYQALKTGVWLGQIGFDDYLNTIEQAYFITQKRSRKSSLIDISKMRWNGDVSSVYAKGLLVAFLCDVAILKRSKGKRDVRSVFVDVYRKYSSRREKLDANSSIINVLQQYNELDPIIQNYVNGKEKIAWANSLSAIGIENGGTEINAELSVRKKLSRRQKVLLKKLGYNKRRNFIRQKINRDVN